MRSATVTVGAMMVLSTVSTVASMPVPGRIPEGQCVKLDNTGNPVGYEDCKKVGRSNKVKQAIIQSSIVGSLVGALGLIGFLGCRARGGCGGRKPKPFKKATDDQMHKTTENLKHPSQDDGTLKQAKSLKDPIDVPTTKSVDDELAHMADDVKVKANPAVLSPEVAKTILRARSSIDDGLLKSRRTSTDLKQAIERH